ncbi:hypothetical protein KKD04_00795 [Patescibacteria group bacterium]|nr:hypothetical protein [Patescibacteria group bacterium]
MENKENIQNKEKYSENPLVQAYRLTHEKEPSGLEDWQIAKNIVEILDDANWISSGLAKECIYHIVHLISYPDNKTKMNIVMMAEEKARNVFPELSMADEVHMDQIEYVYNKWKEKQKNE